MTDGRRGLLVIVPAWNEEASVGLVVSELRSLNYEVIVVDDGSTDMTSREAERAGAGTIRLPVNLGVGAALRCGFRYAVDHGHDAVVQVDADGQHPAGSIDSLCTEAATSGAHLVTGSRFAMGSPGMHVGRSRRLVMLMLSRSASRAARTRITDATSGFRLIREPLLSQFARTFPAHYLGDTYEALISAGRSGYVIREVPVTMRDRTHGESSASRVSAVQLTLRAVIIACTGLRFPVELAGSAPNRAAAMRPGRSKQSC